jgi:hypothetical protein
MAQDNEHVQRLIAARDREVARRRDIAERLAEKHDRGDTENMREAFIKSRTQLKPSSVPFGMRDILPTKSPNRFRLSASEVDSTASANAFDSDADIAKKPALLRPENGS